MNSSPAKSALIWHIWHYFSGGDCILHNQYSVSTRKMTANAQLLVFELVACGSCQMSTWRYCCRAGASSVWQKNTWDRRSEVGDSRSTKTKCTRTWIMNAMLWYIRQSVCRSIFPYYNYIALTCQLLSYTERAQVLQQKMLCMAQLQN